MVNYNNVGVTQLAGTPSVGQVITATSGTASSWQTPVIADSIPVTGLSAINTTALTDIGPTFTVPAVGAGSGASYKLTSTVNITAVGTAGSDNIIIAVYYGGIAGTQLVNLNPSNAAGSIVGSVALLRIEADVVFTATTASTTVLRAYTLAASGNGAAPAARAGSFGQTGLTAGGNQVLTLAWQYQQTTGSPSVTPVFSDVLRVS